MTTPRPRIDPVDLRRLVRGDSPDERAGAAHKLCRSMDRASMTAQERAAAQDILRILAQDAAELVRRALAVTLRSSDLLPPDVARRLIRDVDTVALPILTNSPVLTDEDLAAVVEAGSAVRQIAVARRPRLSERLTRVIADKAVEEAVRAAAANDDARFAPEALDRALERFPNRAVAETVARRSAVPRAVAEKLVSLVGESLREQLVAKHGLSASIALRLAHDSRERATLDLIDEADGRDDLAEFVAHLNRAGRLTASLLLRALAQGRIGLFEHGLAELAGVPHHRAWLMVHDAGPLGLRAIYERAGLPARLYAAFRAGVDACRSVQLDGGPQDRERFQERVLQRFLTQRPYASREDLAYLLEKLDRRPDHLDRTRQANAA